MELTSLLEILRQYFQEYGYYLLFIILTMENTVALGLVVPGETVLLVASFLAAQGDLSLGGVILSASAGALVGNNLGYLLGRQGGRPLINRFGKYFFVSRERVEAAERYFDKHGHQAVFIGRFAAGIRVFVAALAGASRMHYSKFLAYTLASVLLWTTGVALVGYLFGRNLKLITQLVSGFGWAVAVAVILFIFWRLYRWWRVGES